MSGSSSVTTVVMTTADQVSCIAFEVMSSRGDENKGAVALGVSFAVAFVVGGLLALLALVLYFRYFARKDKVFSSSENKDVEDSDERSASNSYQRLKRGSEPSIANDDWGSELQRRDTLVPNDLHISLHVIALINVDPYGFLSLVSTSDHDVEFLRMDMLAVADLERALVEERINAKMLCMREILSAQVKRNSLTKAQIYELLRKVSGSVSAVIATVQRHNEANCEVLKKKMLKDSQVVEIEMTKDHLRGLTLVTMAVQKADEVFRRTLAESTNLNPDEVKVMGESLLEHMARVEGRLRDERVRQTIFLEEGQMRRKCLSESLELREEFLVAEISGRQNAFSHVLQSLDAESTISERVKTELQRCFMDELISIHSKLSLDFQQTKLNQLALMKQKRQEKLLRLTEEGRIRTGQFFVGLDRKGTDNALAQSYLELRSEVRRQRNDQEDDLDQEEAEAVDGIYEEFEHVSQKSLSEADERLRTILRSQGRLSERDANNAMRLYQSQLQQEQKMVNIERRERMRRIRERLPSADQKSEESVLARLRSEEEEELRTKLERLLHGIFRTQTLLTAEAKKTAQKRHEQKLIGVTNQLVMANRTCQKALIWLSGMRRRLTEEFTNNTELETKNSKDKKTKKFLETKKNRKLEDSQQWEKMANDLEAFFRLEANKMEEEVLREHDRFLAELIGHQVAAEARKRTLTSVRKDTTIYKLEDRIMNELDSRLDHKETLDRYLDVISQQHLTEVSEMIEEMGLARSRRNDQIVEKLESRQHTREREIASDLNQQARNQWTDSKNFLVEHFERIAFQQLFQDSLSDLKLDCFVEIERLRQEVSMELENELHQQLTEQKKIFLAQVIGMTKVTKDVIEDLITAAVAEAGGDDKQASKLLKEFLLEVQKAKINSGFDQRLPQKTKPTDSLQPFDRSTPTKIQRSKTDLGLTYPLSRQDTLERPKSRLQSYQNQSYLKSDDETSSIDQQRSLPHRPRSAFNRSAEV